MDSGGIAKSRITHSDNKGWLAFDATVKELGSLLEAEYHEYEHSYNGKTFAACDKYHLPGHIRPHIDYITPGVKAVRMDKRQPFHRHSSEKSRASELQGRGFGRPSAGRPINPPKQRPPPASMQKYLTNQTANCDVAITPACIQALYRVPAGTPGRIVNPNNSFGVFEEGDFYSQEDLNLFFANFTPYIPAGTHPIPNFVDGANAPVPVAQAGGESDLDLQLAYPIIYPQTVTLYQTDDLFYSNSPNSTASGIFNTFLDAIDGVSNRCLIYVVPLTD